MPFDYKTIVEKIIKLKCDEIDIVDFTEVENNLVFTIKGATGCCSCPECGTQTNKRKDQTEYKNKYPMKHIVLSDKRCLCIQAIRRYWTCGNCKKDFMEKFSFEAEKGKHTKLFEQYVQYSWGVMAGTAIGVQTGCSNGKIHKILKNLDPESINKEGIDRMKSADRIYLGIDEHSFRGRDYVLVITDIRERIPLAVLNDNKMPTIEKWMNELPIEIIKKIDGVANDMHKGYKNVIESATRKDLGVVDKFHLFQEANRMVDEVRKINTWLIKMNVVERDQFITQKKIPNDVQMKQSDTVMHSKYKLLSDAKILDESTFRLEDLINKKGEKTEFKEITLSFYLNSSGYRGLLRTREKNLSGIQRLRLRQILREFDWKGYMTEAWSLKERFCDAMDEKDIIEIKDILQESLKSEHYRVKEFGRTLKRWFKQIMNYCEHNEKDFSPTNAYTECFNGQCKTAKRVSYGFRHKDNYRRKLGSRFTEKIKKSRLEIENRKKVEKSFEDQNANLSDIS